MEQHPIPQNVTTFQFRLIGDMTIKQFGYLAGGAILAYICYKLPLPFFFTWPTAILSAVGGFGLAFVPIEERPMDVWVMSFIKNVYSPTLFVWQKTAAKPPSQTLNRAPAVGAGAVQTGPSVTGNKPVTLPSVAQISTPIQPQTTLNNQARTAIHQLFGGHQTTQQSEKPQSAPVLRQGPLDMLRSLFFPAKRENPSALPGQPSSVQRQQIQTPQPPSSLVAPQNPTNDQEMANIEAKIKNLQQEITTKANTQQHILDLKKQLADVVAQKNTLEKEVLMLRQKSVKPVAPAFNPPFASPKQPPMWNQTKIPPVPFRPKPMPIPSATKPSSPTGTPVPWSTPRQNTTAPDLKAKIQPSPVAPPPPEKPQGPTVKVITPDTAVKAGLPRLTTFANVITGIVKDNNGNLLPGILVTAKDKDGMPLRALKTNKLGQFAASTPLPNGVYFIEAEDPRLRYNFDRAQVTLNGSVLPALEIFAKSERDINRDNLAKQIFGNQPI